MFSKTRVAILRGGPSSEYHVSLKTGATVLAHLPEQYHALDVFIDREGEWHVQGKREDPHKILGRVDVVWNALHGEFGEDGGVQHILESHAVPFSGPKRLAAVFSWNKPTAKDIVGKAGIKSPFHKMLRSEELGSFSALGAELYRTFPQPCIIKPAAKGSSLGVSLARTPQEIEAALTAAFSIADSVLVEEYIEGKEALCGVIEGFRGSEFYPLVPVEIQTSKTSGLFDFETRYGGEAEHRCPGLFTAEEKQELQSLAVDVHRLLGLRHYSRSEFVVHPKRGIFFIEADALPELHEGVSPFLQSLHSVGGTISGFVDHVLTLALRK